MNEILDVEAIYRDERQRWLRDEAPRRSVRDVIANSVPYWIVVVAAVLYGLSAPHTASVFDKLTPGWGWIAPIGVEFGLLYAAFHRRLARHSNEAVAWTLWALEILLFLTAMLVNGAGAFSSVVTATQLDTLSFAAIAYEFGPLPATSQAALVMAGLAAFIIPIGALVAGDGLAAIALKRRGGDFREDEWHEVEFTVIYRAVYVRYMQQGLPERDARIRATTEVKGYLGNSRPSGVRLLSAPTGQGEQGANGQADATINTVKGRVRAYLAAHPELAGQSVNQVVAALGSSGIQAGRTTVAEVLKEVKQTV
ncbi:MAG: hypothetical protein ACYDEO_16575 [Aggregatilineales bacterium]